MLAFTSSTIRGMAKAYWMALHRHLSQMSKELHADWRGYCTSCWVLVSRELTYFRLLCFVFGYKRRAVQAHCNACFDDCLRVRRLPVCAVP